MFFEKPGNSTGPHRLEDAVWQVFIFTLWLMLRHIFFYVLLFLNAFNCENCIFFSNFLLNDHFKTIIIMQDGCIKLHFYSNDSFIYNMMQKILKAERFHNCKTISSHSYDNYQREIVQDSCKLGDIKKKVQSKLQVMYYNI